ncbi:MAG TPA: RNA polymerase sigma factor [Acidimicrobiales bacterium]|jgi:RNA polymerase sigma-70 factor (ECF subfamily)
MSANEEAYPAAERLSWSLSSDPAAFAAFYRCHIDQMMAFASRRCRSPHDVADVVQRTFLLAMTRSQTYDPVRGTPTMWLYGIAANEVRNQHRRARADSRLHDALSGRRHLEQDDIARLEQMIDSSRQRWRLSGAFEGLSDAEKDAFLLVHVEQCSPAEACRILGINPIALRARLSRARRRLRATLEAQAVSHPVPSTITTVP